jgi:ribosomal protein S18 acetylase RimI-like enzyme
MAMIRVVRATPTDAEDLAELLQELDEFYGGAARETVSGKLANIDSALFADSPPAAALLAWDESNLVGFASYSILWPAVLSAKSLYLKELYVKSSHRHAGVGRLLMAGIFKAAREQECSRVEWTTDQDNKDAQAFYERLGISPHRSKLFYRHAIADVLEGSDHAGG